LDTCLGRLPGGEYTEESQLPCDEYTGESQLPGDEYTGEPRLPGSEYTGESITNSNNSLNIRKIRSPVLPCLTELGEVV
jgi:hypothetical protein